MWKYNQSKVVWKIKKDESINSSYSYYIIIQVNDKIYNIEIWIFMNRVIFINVNKYKE